MCPLAAQFKPLPHAKAVLFIHHRQPQIGKFHILLKHRVRAHQYLNIPLRQRRELGLARRPLVTPGQDFQPHARLFRQRPQPLQMLPRQNFRRRHHHTLPARFNRDQQRLERHQRLARAHIALQ